MPGHTGPVKAVAWAQLDNVQGIFVSGSHDQTAILWHWKVEENAVQCVTVLRGHERGIECVRANPTGTIIVSSGWDSYIKLWSASKKLLLFPYIFLINLEDTEKFKKYSLKTNVLSKYTLNT